MAQAWAGRQRRGAAAATPPARRNLAGRYGLLLLVLLASYVLSAFNGQRLGAILQVGLFGTVLLLALRTAQLPRRPTILAGAVALLGSVAAVWAELGGTQAGAGAAQLWKGTILLLAAVLIVRRVLAMPTVTIQSIYGALSAYIIIGLMFAAFYAAIGHLGGADFFASGKPANLQNYQYFSFSTLTTLGYGDFTAATEGGRAVAVMEALTGQVFLVTLVARLVTAFRPPAERSGE